MSLINDALKKAQKQRTGEAPTLASMPSVGGESPQRIARRAKPAGFDSLMLRAGIGAAVVLVLGVGGWLALREKPETGRRLGADGVANLKPEDSQAQTTTPSSPSAPVTNPQVSGLRSQVSEPTSTQPPSPTFTLPVAPSPAAKQPDEPRRSASSGGGPAATAAAPATKSPAPDPQVSGLRSQVSASAPAAPAPKLDPRAIEYIENIKVAGIRVSATDPKVLMNDRVYRPGSQVSAEFGLKLVEIATGALTFEDEKGGRYTRTF